MSRIFISYRRGDTSAYAGRIYDRLSDHFGGESVFIDVDTIEPGADFVRYIEEAVGSCDVLVAVIGNDWSTAVDARGERRLDDPGDFVRLEVSAGLARDVRVIPVLVEGAIMPPASELPDELGLLAGRNALELSDTRWRHDVGRLVETIDKVLQGRNPQTAIAEAPPEVAASGAPAAADSPTQPPPLVGGAPTQPPPVPGAAPTEPAPAPSVVLEHSRLATIAMWLGVASVPLGIIALGLLPGIAAIVLGLRVRSAVPAGTTYRAKATAGVWTGLAGCALALLIILLATYPES